MTRLKRAILLTIFGSVCLSGCGTRAVYVRAGDVVQLRQPLRKIKVWVFDAQKKKQAAVIDLIPEGWYCVDDPGK